MRLKRCADGAVALPFAYALCLTVRHAPTSQTLEIADKDDLTSAGMKAGHVKLVMKHRASALAEIAAGPDTPASRKRGRAAGRDAVAAQPAPRKLARKAVTAVKAEPAASSGEPRIVNVGDADATASQVCEANDIDYVPGSCFYQVVKVRPSLVRWRQVSPLAVASVAVVLGWQLPSVASGCAALTVAVCLGVVLALCRAAGLTGGPLTGRKSQSAGPSWCGSRRMGQLGHSLAPVLMHAARLGFLRQAPKAAPRSGPRICRQA